ncbi:MAG: hypothetical protein GY774_25640 [Planctomycetes bacterium]|nr:hypothetical protein [Planctomycetota bacterium]
MKLHPEESEIRSERQQFDGYIARHYCVDTNCGFRIEIQVASAMIHAWMEAEHDILYKNPEGIKLPKSHELATIDGLNGLALAGDTILNGLKLQLLTWGTIKYKGKSERLSFQISALEQSKKEFTLVGQNLYRTLVGENNAQKQQAIRFKNKLIERLKSQDSLKVYIIVADPRDNQQMKGFGYGFPEFKKHLDGSVEALKKLSKQAGKEGLGDRLKVGTHEKISLDSLTLSDPNLKGGVAFLTYTSLGSHPEHRAIRKIEIKKHEDHFKEIIKDRYRWRFKLKRLWD